jgi:hypothetical protein
MAPQVVGRGADRGAKAHTADGKWIPAAVEQQRTGASADAHDKAALGDYGANYAGIR